jgi:hypothetical protein
MKEISFKKGKIGRGAIGAIFCALIMLASMATAINLSEKNNEVNSLNYTFLFKGPKTHQTVANNEDYTLIDMKGCYVIGRNVGEPLLPIKSISLLIPPMKNVASIHIKGTPVEIDIVENPIVPYQNPVPFGQNQEEFVISDSVYSADINYPGILLDDYQIGYSHGYTILNVNLNPVQYNPVKGEVNYYPEMMVEIELEDSSEMNQFFRNNPEDKDYVENLVSNIEVFDTYTSEIPTFGYDGGLCDPDDNYDYVIVTTEHNGLDHWETSETIPYNWDSLMDRHMSDDGLSCTLVTVQEIEGCTDYHDSDPLFNDQEAHIREFVKDAYLDWGTSYILIGGDDENNWIPAREMETGYEGNIDSDIYWSNLDKDFNGDEDNYWGEAGDDGFDTYCEIFIGRLTCDEPQDVSNWMTKSFYYADCIEPEFLECAGFYGGDTGWNCQGDDFMDYSAIKGTDDWLGPNPGADGPFPTWAGFQYGFETWNSENPNNQYDISEAWTAESPNPGWQGGSQSQAINGFKDAINDDKIAIASGIAHANANMALDVGSSSWESDYHNTKPFFLHDYGCHCGDMDAADDGVLHSMLFHSDTELAFAVVFNTCYGWGNFDTTNSSSAFQAKEFWSYFLDMENKSEDFNNWRLGKGHAFSKDRMAATIDWDQSYQTWRAIIQGCLLFGDPAQKIKTPHPSEAPMNPAPPDGPDEWIQDVECTFSAVTTDPEGEQVFYLFDWGDGNFSSWLGPYPSGETITTTHIWPNLGDYELRVRARDIWGVTSDWSDPHILSIVENEKPVRVKIDGPTWGWGGTKYEFTFESSDPDLHQIYYVVDWDDGERTDPLGPYNSGESISLEHSWKEKGKYWIKAWAIDTMGGESSQATFIFNVLSNGNKQISSNFIINYILERLSARFPLFTQILQNVY